MRFGTQPQSGTQRPSRRLARLGATQRFHPGAAMALSRLPGWQRAAFGEDLHVLECPREGRQSSRAVRFPGRVVRQHRIIEDQGIDQLRRGLGDRPRLEGSVIEVVWSVCSGSLCVGIGQLGLSDENLVADATHGAERVSRARRELARNPEPFSDISISSDAFPHLGCGAVNVDLHWNGRVGR